MRKAIVAFALLLSACHSREWLERLSPKDEEQFAVRTFELVQQRNFAEAGKRLDPSISRDGLEPKLAKVADLFGSEKPRAVHLIGWKTFVAASGTKRVRLTLEYELPRGWLLATVKLRTEDGSTTIEAFNVVPAVDSQEHLNRVTLRGKTATQYAYLLLAVLVPLFILLTIYVLWRTPVARLKWLWFVFVSLGIGAMSINWTTGQSGVNPLFVTLLGFGFGKGGPYAPLIISWGIPVGAIVFLMRRRSLMPAPQAPEEGLRLDVQEHVRGGDGEEDVRAPGGEDRG